MHILGAQGSEHVHPPSKMCTVHSIFRTLSALTTSVDNHTTKTKRYLQQIIIHNSISPGLYMIVSNSDGFFYLSLSVTFPVLAGAPLNTYIKHSVLTLFAGPSTTMIILTP